MCSHYLVEPVACTPASGWEKGQVESQVGLVRERFFAPRLKVKSYDELNAWLVDKCLAWAKSHAHPEQSERTIWEVFEEERPKLMALSEQRQVVCVGRSKRRPKRRLGREGAPLGQRGGAPLFVNLAGDEMALLIEMVVDLGMN